MRSFWRLKAEKILTVGITFLAILSPAAASSSKIRLRESAAIFSSLEPEYSSLPGFAMLSRRSSASWGATRVRSSALSRFSASYETVMCGPSLAVNTLTCYSLPMSRFSADIPTPGYVSAAPVFYDDSWIVPTTKGFIVRMRRTSTGASAFPFQKSEYFSFWGAESRKVMATLKTDGNLGGDSYMWSFALGAEIVGQPIVFGKTYFAMGANQYLYAIDVNTGKPKWTLRVAPDASLRLDSAPITVAQAEGHILVGTSEGLLLALDVQNGSVAWRHRLESVAGQRFQSLVAKPLVYEKSVIASTAEGVTERISFDRCSGGSDVCVGENRAVEWKYPLGSIASPRRFDNGVVVGGHEGTLVLLDPRSGALRWKKSVFPGSSVASVDAVTLAGAEYLVAASVDGAISVLDRTGQILDSLPPVGEVTGEFFAGHEASDVCLSFVSPGVRCFSVGF